MSADQDQVFQEDNDQRQRTAMPSQEQDKFLAELALRHFLSLAERGMTSLHDVVAAKSALRTLGVNL